MSSLLVWRRLVAWPFRSLVSLEKHPPWLSFGDTQPIIMYDSQKTMGKLQTAGLISEPRIKPRTFHLLAWTANGLHYWLGAVITIFCFYILRSISWCQHNNYIVFVNIFEIYFLEIESCSIGKVIGCANPLFFSG